MTEPPGPEPPSSVPRCPSVCLSVSLSVSPCPSGCPSVSLSLPLGVPRCPSVCPSVSLRSAVNHRRTETLGTSEASSAATPAFCPPRLLHATRSPDSDWPLIGWGVSAGSCDWRSAPVHQTCTASERTTRQSETRSLTSQTQCQS
uniref:Uncharacterized protein n=1 Tax=Salarias fasciatus TaxID=181472 RepID=A0A672I822_SALFA